MPNLLDVLEETFDWRKPNPPLSKLFPPNHLSLQLAPLTKEKMLPHSNLPPRPHQAFPFIRFLLQLFREQNFNLPLQEFRAISR